MKEVLIVASCGMSLIMILGICYEAMIAHYYPKQIIYVDCSYEIVDMARKLNVTLSSRCIINQESI